MHDTGDERRIGASPDNRVANVLGRTGAGLGRRLMVGSVAYLVLHTAHCPVFVIGESGEAVPAHDAA